VSRVLVIGAGIFGTMHAYFAHKAGHDVTLIERDPRPMSASVRNFGMVAVGGRAPGEELQVALRARELWGEIASDHPSLTFRPSGSIVVATAENHLDVMHKVAQYPDAHLRGWTVLDRSEAQDMNPGLQGRGVEGGLFCSEDAVVEPDRVLDELRETLEFSERFAYFPSTAIDDVSQKGTEVVATSHDGRKFLADWAIVVPGADHTTLFPGLFSRAPLRRVFLQMARLADPGVTLTTSIASADSLRFYPGYQGDALEGLEPVRPLVSDMVMQLLLQQRVDGTLTMGDTHIYDEPFPHEMREDCYELLLDDVESIVGVRPEVQTRWSGIYSQNTTGAVCIREKADERIIAVTGPGGRGNTLSPAIAETTIRELIDA
jgi:FAD dependent oxidoreductase TIGR03364